MHLRRLAVGAIATLTLAACSGTGGGASSTGSTSAPGSRDAGGSSAGSSGAGSASGSAGQSSATSSAPPPTCAEQTAATLSPKQKAAQLVLVSMTPSSIGTASEQITLGNAAGVFLLGGWNGTTATANAAATIHALSASAGGIGTWVTIDQEGGEVQQLKGPGASVIPSALEQAELGAGLEAQATAWASELKAAGIDINLAPVADVVPADVGTKNAPIGLYGRQYGATPEEVTTPMIAFMKGMQAGGVQPTIKHFPGIGRILGNTDKTTAGISDETMITSDPFLQPFKAAIDAGAPIVMISTARYPKIDPQNQAAFSSAIITDLLRGQLGFDGVTFTDDVGAAKSVEAVPVAERITRYVDAGGDVVLTAQPTQAQTMNDAVVSKYGSDPAFAAKVDAAATRVLELKDEQELLPCSAN